MNGGPSIVRRSIAEKSNTELITSLRTNFIASQQAWSTLDSSAITTNGTAKSRQRPPLSSWTIREEGILYIPSVDFSISGLAEERSQYDITVKLFYLPNASVSQRSTQTKDVIDLVLKELHVPSIDLLIVSFPGVTFDAEDEGDDEEKQEDLEYGNEVEDIESMINTWRTLEGFQEKGTIGKLGVSEFSRQRLERFLSQTKIPPSVDQINVRDCCVVPKPLILFARQEGIELLTHSDCMNILPRGTTRDLLGSGEQGVGVLGGSDDGGEGLKGDVEPQLVVKYTAVVRDRGVVENKGYFAVADLYN
ncbi:MAG: hypothetical protein M1827_004150 [Pycnora praestabilis]|nr:MAG: hypothetical protein M1827_004150 [Pycnora praestabilis]